VESGGVLGKGIFPSRQLASLGSAVSSPSGVQGKAQQPGNLMHIMALESVFCVVFTKYFAQENSWVKRAFPLNNEHQRPIPELSRQIVDGWYA